MFAFLSIFKGLNLLSWLGGLSAKTKLYAAIVLAIGAAVIAAYFTGKHFEGQEAAHRQETANYKQKVEDLNKSLALEQKLSANARKDAEALNVRTLENEAAILEYQRYLDALPKTAPQPQKPHVVVKERKNDPCIVDRKLLDAMRVR